MLFLGDKKKQCTAQLKVLVLFASMLGALLVGVITLS